MRQSLVIGNWKMHGSSASVADLLSALKEGLDTSRATLYGVCAPYVFIPQVAEALRSSAILFGSQNVADQVQGAFTGEISAPMLKEFGCSLALVGHSERRSLYGETDALIAARFDQAVKGGIRPVLCIGETLAEREAGTTEAVVDEQLNAVIDHCGMAAFANAVIAYEPVWAIGTGKTATSAQAQEIHAHIRKRLAERDPALAQRLPILYGGSVKADNAEELFSMPDIDGGLIGGASLDPAAFIKICHSTRS